MKLRNAAWLTSLLVAVATLGCAKEGYKTTEPSTALQVTPKFFGSAETDAGFPTVDFDATAGGAAATVTWESSDPTVATVSAAGIALPLKAGFTAITATAGTAKSSASLTVTAFPGTLITAGTAVTGIAGNNTTKLYRVVVPAGTTSLNVNLSGGTGDTDLFVNPLVPATSTTNVCASEGGSNAESCVIANPVAGRWYILLQYFGPVTGATLLVTRTP